MAVREFLPSDVAERGQDGVSVWFSSEENSENFHFFLTRFLDEARLATGFSHPNLERVRGVFEENGTAYMVRDYHRGETLHKHLEKLPDKRMPETEASSIMRSVLEGLRVMHGKGILHRDVKPTNIFLAEGGRPILMDFGAARPCSKEQMTVILTPGYAPPEQYYSRGIQGFCTDIYACAATLYRMVSGQTPLEAPARAERDQLRPLAKMVPGVSAGFSAAVQRGLALNAADRPQSIEAFLRLLEGDPTQSARQGGGMSRFFRTMFSL